MRAVPLISLVGLLLGACAGPKFGDAPITGFFEGLTMADIRAAVAAHQSDPGQLSHDVAAIDIVSDSEIHIYPGRRNHHLEIYRDVRLVRGQWKSGDTVFVTYHK